MYVKRVYYDDNSKSSSEEKVINYPLWDDVKRIIDMLDGKNVTQIMMDDGNEENYLCIGGGNDGLCNAYISTNDGEKIFTLVKSDSDNSVVHKLITGGQEGEFEDRICVTVDTAKSVAKEYYESGQIDGCFESVIC